jgi:hypothetical protein
LNLGSVSCSVVSWACAARRRAGAGPRPARAGRPGCRAGSRPGRPAPEPAVRSTRQRPHGRAVRPRIDGSDRLVGELFGGTGEGAHALINSSVTLEAGMMASSRASSGAGPTRFEQRRLRCRESTPDAYRRTHCHGSHRGHWDRPARPKLGVRPAAPSHGELRGGASPAGPWRCTAGPHGPGAVALRLPRHVAA